MFAFAQLRELERRLRNRKVLSVFVDTSDTDPTKGSTWRDELNRALLRLDAMPPYVSSGERTARELCIAHLRTALEGMRGAPGRPAWVAYVTTDDVVAAGPVRARLDTGVFWQTGIVVTPFRFARASPAPSRWPTSGLPRRPTGREGQRAAAPQRFRPRWSAPPTPARRATQRRHDRFTRALERGARSNRGAVRVAQPHRTAVGPRSLT